MISPKNHKLFKDLKFLEKIIWSCYTIKIDYRHKKEIFSMKFNLNKKIDTLINLLIIHFQNFPNLSLILIY